MGRTTFFRELIWSPCRQGVTNYVLKSDPDCLTTACPPQLYVEWPIGPEGPNITVTGDVLSDYTIYVAYTYLQGSI
jgi:hypothetical protein